MKIEMTLEPIGVPPNERPATPSSRTTDVRSLAADLSQSLGERNLLQRVLDAVQTVDAAALKAEEARLPGFRPQKSTVRATSNGR